MTVAQANHSTVLSFSNTSFKFLAHLVVNSKYIEYFIKIPEVYFSIPHWGMMLQMLPFNNLIDSSFEAEASVGKHGDIFPCYGFVQSKPQPHFCCDTILWKHRNHINNEISEKEIVEITQHFLAMGNTSPLSTKSRDFFILINSSMEFGPRWLHQRERLRHWAEMKLKNTHESAFRREHFNTRGVIDWTKTTECSTSERLITDNKSDVPEIRLDMYDKDRKLSRRPCMFLILLMCSAASI